MEGSVFKMPRFQLAQVLLAQVLLALVACAEPSAGANPDPTAALPDRTPGPPPAGKADDPNVQIDGLRNWYLIGNALTQGDDSIALTVQAPDSTELIHVWLNRELALSVSAAGGRAELSVEIGALPPGEHEILLSADDSQFAFAQRFFKRSHPLYVAVSNDWDTPDHGDAMLERQERLHARHPELVLTHFVGPYTFTDPALSVTRAARLVEWVTTLRDREGDEIGLHIHPWCHFVESAGLVCKTERSFARPRGDATGRTVYLGSYSEDELFMQLEKAVELFVEHGLGRPTSFRAGGWTLEPQTMRALERAGFVADTSAANWHRIEEWEHTAGASLYTWLADNWQSIDETSQPYYPSQDDLLSEASPRVTVLEVPDNGLLVDYVTATEMIEMFQINLKDGLLAAPAMYSIGYHPISFSEAFFVRMDEALTHIDGHLAAQDLGSVVYARLSDLPAVWPRE